MSINYALAGQLAVCWIAISFATAPFIGRYLRRRRKETTIRLPRDPMKYEGRDLTEAQKRKAEALGFMDEIEAAVDAELYAPKGAVQ